MVYLFALIKESSITICWSILFIHGCRSICHIDESDVFFTCKLLHVIGIVHSMIIGRKRIILFQLIAIFRVIVIGITYFSICISQIMTGAAAHTITTPTITANRRHQYRNSTLCFYFVDDFLQPCLVCC